MDDKAIFKYCKQLGCCDACCCRYLGVKNSIAYEKVKDFVIKYLDKNQEYSEETTELSQQDDDNSPPPKRLKKGDVCVSCFGMLQEEHWPECNRMVTEMLDRKKYVCKSYACGLSAPLATLLREKVVCLLLSDIFKDYDSKVLIPLKEAWKWSFGINLAKHIDKALDSGAVSPLLITINMEYPDDIQELEELKSLVPKPFQDRNKSKPRFGTKFTRNTVEQALKELNLEMLRGLGTWGAGVRAPSGIAKCVSVMCTHTPVYLGGRYIKLSRILPQTPWMVRGERMMDSSVQEIIFEPIAKAYGMSTAEAEHRLKFMSAGREDVDVRCLGDGRPFAIEISDPNRELSAEECERVCRDVSADGRVLVRRLVPIDKNDLVQLKQGEETKCKTYEALCIKLGHSKGDETVNGETAVIVTDEDIHNINTYSNTDPDDPARIVLSQKTPIRVLHRRPLLTRKRKIFDVTAAKVEGHPSLLVLRVRAEAGTYVKEWVHGELGRTRPSLADAARAPVDILALDVSTIHLQWPNK